MSDIGDRLRDMEIISLSKVTSLVWGTFLSHLGIGKLLSMQGTSEW